MFNSCGLEGSWICYMDKSVNYNTWEQIHVTTYAVVNMQLMNMTKGDNPLIFLI
jgi:hypothetical protein